MNYLPRDLWNYLSESEGVRDSYGHQALHGYSHWAHRECRAGVEASRPRALEIWTSPTFARSLRESWDNCYVIAVSYSAILNGWDLLSLLRLGNPSRMNFYNLGYVGIVAAMLGRLGLIRELITTYRLTPEQQTRILAASIDAKFARLLMPHLMMTTGDLQSVDLVLCRDEVELFLVFKQVYPNVNDWHRRLGIILGQDSSSKILAYVKEHGL